MSEKNIKSNSKKRVFTWNYVNFGETAFSDTVILERAQTALDDIFDHAKDHDRPVLSLAYERDDLAEIEQHAKRIAQNTSDVLVIGIGGSSLGGQALLQACGGPKDNCPNIRFPDNLAPFSFPKLLKKLNPKTTRIIAISKSGGTMETHAQLAVTMEWLKGSDCTFADHITLITENKESPFTKMARIHNLPTIDHLVHLGGRFSALSNVCLLPAAIAGFDIKMVREGAAHIMQSILRSPSPIIVPAAKGAEAIITGSEQSGETISVVFPYNDHLEKFGEWYCQLWAESLGKNGKGTTPIVAMGPVDQHSQLQLFMEGPRDKTYTFITVDKDESYDVKTPLSLGDIGMDHLAGRSLQDVVAAMAEGTRNALSESGLPVRHMRINRLDEFAVGAMFMHFILETLFGGAMLNINPFGQPGVERCKVLAREYLEKLI